MNKYSNFTNASGTDSSTRFNKNCRYGTNNTGSNNSPRFSQPNQSAYSFSQKRSNAADCYNSNQYEKNNNRNFYNNSSKRQNYNNKNKQSTYSKMPAISSPVSKSSSTFPSSPQNAVNLSPSQHSTQSAPVTNLGQNNQHPQQFGSNYYGFDYNFYTYNSDIYATTSNIPLCTTDGLTPHMWQTITSTPPPKLPQQLQPPMPLQQPPLPLQQPPTSLPPLPPSTEVISHVAPPAPISVCSSAGPSKVKNSDKKNSELDSDCKTIVKMKAKRKTMSMRYKLSKSWTEKDAILALKAEEVNSKKMKRDIILIIRFPDPVISREIVKCYSPDIESVHFQLNFAPRYCLVHLKPGADVEKTIEDLSKISFGTGYLSVEIKQIPYKVHPTKLNEVDPFTLYVGNLPTTIACKTLKDHFPGAARIDIGFAQRMKYTRYAFIRYQNVEQAIEAYKRMLHVEIGGRTLTIRFRRLAVHNDGNKDGEPENHDDLHEDLLNQAVVASDDNIEKLTATSSEHTDPITNDYEDNTNNLPNVIENNTMETDKNAENISAESNFTENHEIMPPIICPEKEPAPQAEKSNTLLVNIKTDPDVDPDDIVVRSNIVPPILQVANNDIKQEEENLALYMEFFENPTNQNERSEKSNRNDTNSLHSTADEGDTMSPLSSNSLGEFLQTCHRRQTQEDNVDDLGPPPAKIHKVIDDNLPITIKKEPLKNGDISNVESLFSNDTIGLTNVKQEGNNESINLHRENHIHLPQNTCSNYNKKVSSIKKTSVSTNISKDSYNSATSNEDMVPPTAVFFKNNCGNFFSPSPNISDYDEFYETRVSNQASVCVANVKKEHLETSSAIGTHEINKTKPGSERLTKRNFAANSMANNANHNLNSATVTNCVDDDDLVPAQNILGSYRPLCNFVKNEKEHDDMFLVPYQKPSQLSEAFDPRNTSITNMTPPSNNCRETTEFSKTYPTEDNDEDIIIISQNIKPTTNNSQCSTSASTNLFIPKQADLVSVKYKPNLITTPNRKVSNLIYSYDLDKLYDQLDADSDSEL